MTDLRAARIALGLTVAELAEKIGVSRVTLHRWETGQSRPIPALRLAWERAIEREKTGREQD